MLLGNNCPPVEKDAADALAIAICGSRHCNKLISKAA
jgi:Holliday junction resolvasome RuvABC endonuclease subunit